MGCKEQLKRGGFFNQIFDAITCQDLFLPEIGFVRRFSIEISRLNDMLIRANESCSSTLRILKYSRILEIFENTLLAFYSCSPPICQMIRYQMILITSFITHNYFEYFDLWIDLLRWSHDLYYDVPIKAVNSFQTPFTTYDWSFNRLSLRSLYPEGIRRSDMAVCNVKTEGWS